MLLLAFALLLLAAAAAMLRRQPDPAGRLVNLSLARVAPAGVGGGFVIVPALMLVLGLPMTLAVRTSLLVIALSSGVALAAHLASGGVDWPIALTFATSAIVAALAGRRLGAAVKPKRLGQPFALLLVAIAVFLVAKNAPGA